MHQREWSENRAVEQTSLHCLATGDAVYDAQPYHHDKLAWEDDCQSQLWAENVLRMTHDSTRVRGCVLEDAC